MKTQLERARGRRIDEICEAVRKSVAKIAPGREDEAERFAQHFFRHVSPRDLQRESDENLVGAVNSMWDFAQRRGRDESNVRVFTPNLEKHGWDSSHTVAEIINDDMPFLVDSITSLFTDIEIEVQLIIHPIVRVERDEDGKMLHWSISAEELPDSGAESLMHRAWGGELIGMTAMPEAKLAREAQMCYALIALASDYDCWLPHEEGKNKQTLLKEIIGNLQSATSNAVELIKSVLENDGELCNDNCHCRGTLQLAVWTAPEQIDPAWKKKLAVLFK